jgi:hypothetical protein
MFLATYIHSVSPVIGGVYVCMDITGKYGGIGYTVIIKFPKPVFMFNTYLHLTPVTVSWPMKLEGCMVTYIIVLPDLGSHNEGVSNRFIGEGIYRGIKASTNTVRPSPFPLGA